MKIQFDENHLLGRGSFGSVFRGTLNRQPVAIKRVQLIDIASRDEEDIEEPLSRLHHPNVIKLLHQESDVHFKYFALELCAASLDQLFLPDDDPKKYRGPMPPYDLIVLLQLANGLEYIHGNDLIHGDVRPENVLISTGTAGSRQRVLVKWADFGLGHKTSFKDKWINSCWIAPEMIDQQEGTINHRRRVDWMPSVASDIFSEGCVFFYFLLGGIHPFGPKWEITSNLVRNKPVNFKSIKFLK